MKNPRFPQSLFASAAISLFLMGCPAHNGAQANNGAINSANNPNNPNNPNLPNGNTSGLQTSLPVNPIGQVNPNPAYPNPVGNPANSAVGNYGGDYGNRPEARALAEKLLAEHNVPIQDTMAILAQAKLQQSILDAMSKPAEGLPWYKYRPRFIMQERMKQGAAFMRKNAAALARAEQQYQVPKAIIASIMGVETRWGEFMGKYRVLDALATLAFDYPKRSAFFTQELGTFVVLTRELGISPTAAYGSYAGAMGQGQFMPSSYRNLAVDFNGDRRIDLWAQTEDAIGSVAHYLHKNGWDPAQPIALRANVANYGAPEFASLQRSRTNSEYVLSQLKTAGLSFAEISPVVVPETAKAGLIELETAPNEMSHWVGLNNFFVITTYNRSPLYAMAVLELAQGIMGQMANNGN